MTPEINGTKGNFVRSSGRVNDRRRTCQKVDDGTAGEDGIGVAGVDIDAGVGHDVTIEDPLVQFSQEFGRQIDQDPAVQHALDELFLSNQSNVNNIPHNFLKKFFKTLSVSGMQPDQELKSLWSVSSTSLCVTIPAGEE